MATQKKPWAIYVWPGLPHIWMRGSWSALGVAVIAAALVCAAMVGSFGWTELITPAVRNALWASLAVVWCMAAIVSAVKLRRDPAKHEPGDGENPFARAVDLYLKGDYYQAERLLKKLLGKNIRDLDARLLLATLLRHTGRFDEASRQLDQLVCFDGAEKWELEIQAERELLAEAGKNVKHKPANGMAIASNTNSSEISTTT
jgi:tetratricopeptide (TPR) repeat protein